MVQKSEIKAKPLPVMPSKSNRWVWILLSAFLITAGMGGYFLFQCKSFSVSDDQINLKALQTARAEIQTLRQQLAEQGSSGQTAQITLANKEALRRISDNFQKIFIFSRLERRVLTGKNFSASFSKLDQLVGPPLQDPRFDILRNNTQGITPPSGIETSFRSYTPPQKSGSGALGEKIFYFFNNFLKIRNFQEKEKIDTLCTLIRNDHTQKALLFIEKNFPEYQEWSQSLKIRLDVKQALRSLEELVFNGLRI
ncbi:MAG: hypothetical protein A2977_03010 [Alphaproteobacteria bacterium RIFCSPLOWO2_01_FULL_45_8]|nr:MAG: hypothetical protein A2065_00115 [Alphaproteobacteria bacterium GWB1_45_5]OFW76089.1 MAG: hypothetical protein A3K20_03070 [Alphaproteobacteria bacterium GWA1_45_9]OFW90255.1 MAG: hypothetical protein A2621_04670 [Alphaproteobacteria bacterium RIFCSPHIGHO2_01_FULL_41_14]OFW95870.1 MAG: hypothetical protein A2977_03010 [Alphaproteobacteria bacterium RIFCSPLOWO2_01_FULL_45_8]HCI48284.1 hypothetical protein [Holosporales bacterium]